VDHFESLISIRVYDIIYMILSAFPHLSAPELYNRFDLETAITTKSVDTKVEIGGGYWLTITEKYFYQAHQLKMLYNYSLLNPDGSLLISYDNSHHHPGLPNFPHHKHYYPKRKYPPISFSGEFADALSDMRWIIERANE